MDFGSVISAYLRQLGCTAKALADASGVSAIQLSRWRSGTRRPSAEMLARIADGIASLSGGEVERKEALDAMSAALPPTDKGQRDGMGRRLDLLLSSLKVRTSEVARVLNFDPSYLSRIRSGKRSPSNIAPITEGVSRFIVRRCTSENERDIAAEIVGVDAEVLADSACYEAVLRDWLRGGVFNAPDHSADLAMLLQTMNDFDPNEYLSALPPEERRTSDAPDEMPKARTVTGLKGMMDCELDFFKATSMSDSSDPVLLYTDMPPLSELSIDPEYPKRWMMAVARLLKKGLRVDTIHSVDRPLEELLLGLEVYIPIYMTGRVRPYYLKEGNKSPFLHQLEVSGAAALSGEAIAGHRAEGIYYLTYEPKELRYYKKRAEALMEKATPLMDVYSEEQRPEFRRFMDAEAERGFVPQQIEIPTFRNITVHVCHDRWAIVVKERAPRVAFVFRHPKLVDAFERFNAPLSET